ncbi:hypothetical protein [Halomonas halocynthiae]|uniref:hypothetical protein n=1 Tax=Halomonas halocynthiae TaxID=176290 RepID=UPI00041FC502|nr:hypothetical protein [Halomonas halocynthiae]
MMNPRRRERLLGLTALATLLFTPPLLLMADRIHGGLWLPVYLFVVWGLVIGLAAWLLEGHAED